MRFKRMIAAVLSSVMLMTAVAVPANAAVTTRKEVLEAWIGGGADISSYVAQKGRAGGLYYEAESAEPGGWSDEGDEWVYLRGRTGFANRVQATSLTHINYKGGLRSGNMSYLAGHGAIGTSYAMAAEYDNNNPYQYVKILVLWTP